MVGDDAQGDVGDRVTIRMTLERRRPDGDVYTQSVETSVTLRN
jgi:hypothetical protein